MRTVALLLLSGCFAGKLDANLRPSVQPKLSELPVDAQKRDAILDQAGKTPGPETPRNQLTGTWRRIETGAAYIAAFLGSAASKTQNVTLGFALTLGDDTAPKPDVVPEHAPAPKKPTIDAGALVPWVPLPAGAASGSGSSD
jgi:hypothetical protein